MDRNEIIINNRRINLYGSKAVTRKASFRKFKTYWN